MLILIDKRIPEAAKKTLSEYGELYEVYSENIVYDSISGHPDIFVCNYQEKIILAPNAPDHLKEFLNTKLEEIISGEQNLGDKHPSTTHYNTVITDKHIIGNFRYVDFNINNSFPDHDPIHVNQAYCRCNLLALKNDHYITSDMGIHTILTGQELNVLYVSPKDIVLPGKPHGFFGGSTGLLNNKVFVTGSLDHYSDGKKVKEYLDALAYEVVELYDGPLFDGGGILFLGNPKGL